jgi:hypothetical protein
MALLGSKPRVCSSKEQRTFLAVNKFHYLTQSCPLDGKVVKRAPAGWAVRGFNCSTLGTLQRPRTDHGPPALVPKLAGPSLIPHETSSRHVGSAGRQIGHTRGGVALALDMACPDG